MTTGRLRAGWDRALAGGNRAILCGVLILNLGLSLYTALATLRDFPNSADEYACVLSAELMSRGMLSVPSPEPRKFFFLYHVVNNGRFYGKYPPGWPALLSIFNFASYFPHPAGLLAVLGMIYLSFVCLEDPGNRWAFAGLGFATGAGFLIRPFTLLIAGLPLGLYLLWRATRADAGASLTRGLCVAATMFAIVLQLFFLYNWALTGDPFLQPFSVYDPHDRLGFSGLYDDLPTRIRETIVLRGLELLLWLPAAPILMFVALFLRTGARTGTRERLLVVIFLVIAALAMNASVFVQATLFHADQVRERMVVYDLVREQGISQAVVFLRTGSGTMPAGDLVRNGVRFNASVLYVHDRGAENSRLLASFPGRRAYRFEYDPAARAGSLIPMLTTEGRER